MELKTKKLSSQCTLATLLALSLLSCDTAVNTTTADAGTTTSANSRAINQFATNSTSIATAFGGNCTSLARDTSSCQSERESLGFTDEWLLFSCNVVLGLANASKQSVTSMGSATYATVTATGLPAHKSNYYPTSGSYSFSANDYTVSGSYNDMYEAYSTSSGNPNLLAQQSYVLYIPLNPVRC